MYAVIKTGGKQYRVQPGDVLVVEKLAGEPGADVAFGEVLMLGDGDASTSPEAMALAAGLSRPQFFRLFKKSTGMSPAVFLNMLKMESGLRSLTQRDVKLQDIAFDLGFDTAGNFTRFFVGMQGFAPSKYRKILEIM